MDFAFSSDQQLLKNSARACLDEHCKPAAVRLLWDDPRGESDTMWKEMAQLGWLGLSLPEAYGGSGLGMVESAILLEELGRAAYPGPYWPTVLAAAAVEAAGNDAQKKRWLSAIATGDARATPALLDADLDWEPAALTTRAAQSAKGAAAEMLGAARRCLDMAVGYAKVREQFGQPIGSFQAIRHKCSEMLLEVENSHSAVYYAAWALDAKAEDHELAASVAKAYVGDAARKVCGEAIQVHGGIGFTWEYDLHIYMKRAKALEPMYGDADYHREQIVRRVAR